MTLKGSTASKTIPLGDGLYDLGKRSRHSTVKYKDMLKGCDSLATKQAHECTSDPAWVLAAHRTANSRDRIVTGASVDAARSDILKDTLTAEERKLIQEVSDEA